MRFLITLIVIFSLGSIVKPTRIRSIYIPTSEDVPVHECGKTPSGLERPDHRCGRGASYAPCDPGRCCSYAGWCGDGPAYCRGSNCKYQCWNSLAQPEPLPNGNNSMRRVISKHIFNEMFKHRKDCPSQGFYSYDAFITAAASFPGFATTGDITTRKRELAAFFGQTSQATTGQWYDSQDPHAWGYCHINETTNWNEKVYCTSSYWPCASGKKYNSRGPAQLTHNYNYGRAGIALGLDLINNPDSVATDPIISFQTAIWFWMTRHDNIPSCHDILLGANSEQASHVPGYGVIEEVDKSYGAIEKADKSYGAIGKADKSYGAIEKAEKSYGAIEKADKSYGVIEEADRSYGEIVPQKSYGVIGEIFNRNSGYQNGLVANTVTTSIGYYKRYCDLLGVSYGHSLEYWYDRPHFSDSRP